MLYSLSFLVAGAGHVVLAGVVAALSRWRVQVLLLAAAFALQGLWALSVTLDVPELRAAAPHLDFGRPLLWTLFFSSVIGRPESGRLATGGLAVAVLAGAYAAAVALSRSGYAMAWQAGVAVEMVAAVFVLAVIAILVRNSDESQRWHLKFLCFPVAGLFAYDLFINAQLLGFGVWTPELAGVRGLLYLLALPLLAFGAVRARLWQGRLSISHQGALYSTALIASGVYLLLVAAIAMAIGALAPDQRLPLQVTFLFAAVLMFLVLLSSGAVRASAKGFIARNFFPRKYDYLHEWRRLLATLADDSQGDTLETRLVQALADIVEAPGGALFSLDESRPRLIGSWNFRPAAVPDLDATAFRDARGALGPIDSHALPEYADIWLVIPLARGPEVIGFIALPPPRAGRRLDSEDRELIMMAATHGASYLAEQRHARALAESRQFERFTRQYAFVVHDIKNIVSQLSLMLKNFERHGHKQAFRKDMTETVANAVARMQALIARIQDLKAGHDADGRRACALADVLAEEVGRLDTGSDGGVELNIASAARGARIHVPVERFRSVVAHLVTNGLEAVAHADTVRVDVDATNGQAVIDVVDHGPGMSPAFVAERLFRPFQSTKNDGLGIGAYQCREFAREFGGDLEVVSSPGTGTTMRLTLPLVCIDDPVEEPATS